MPDICSKSARSAVMSAIRGTGNKSTELRMIKIMREARIVGWRRWQHIIGRPDFVFWKEKTALFVDGCFWHACHRCFRPPGTNQSYWEAKIARNKARDRAVNRQLAAKGWTVVRLWEHSLREPEMAVKRLCSALAAAKARLEKAQSRKEPWAATARQRERVPRAGLSRR